MKVSVIISTYNRRRLLEKALNSVLEQKFDDFEIIIVDDCSTDETSVFLSQYKPKDTITVLRNDQNLGLQKSLNKALTYATGDYIARIDDDDLWIDDRKLEKQYNFLLKNPDVVLLGTGFKTERGTVRNPTSDYDIRKQILFRCSFQHSTVMFKRTVDNLTVLYDDTLNYSEDWDLWLKLGKSGKLINLTDITTFIRTGDNLSEEYFSKQHVQNLKIIKGFSDVYPHSIRAILYHLFVILFFKIFPINGKIHTIFKGIFKRVFKV